MSSIYTHTYDTDDNGNIVQKGSRTYGYDALNRVDDEAGGTTAAFTYDAVNNRLTEVTGSTTTYTYPSTNSKVSAVGGNSYTYDAAGNVTADGARTYVWDDAGRLKEAKIGGSTVGAYTYNAPNQRTKKVAGGNTIEYVFGLGGLLYGEYTNAGALIREYLYLNGEPLAQVDAGTPEVLTYLHTDHLQTPRYGTNSGGTQVWAWNSGAFGKETPTGSATVNLRFPGQYYDSETTLHYNWNRYYNPAIGRYISSDPIGLEGGINTFNYANVSPVMFIDPEGKAAGVLYPVLVAGGVTIVIAGKPVQIICSTEQECAAIADALTRAAQNAGNTMTYWTCMATTLPLSISRGNLDETCQQFADYVCPPASANTADDTKTEAECAEEWEAARERCSELLDMPASERPKEVWGGSFDKCLKGQVSQACGGNRID